MNLQDIIERGQKAGSMKIYGAGKLGKTLYWLFQKHHIRTECFIVEASEENAESIYDIPVREWKDFAPEELKDIIIALENKEKRYDVFGKLLQMGASNVLLFKQSLLDDIYCSYLLDENNLEEFYEQLRGLGKIYVVVNDMTGVIKAETLVERQIPVEAVITMNPGLQINFDIGVPIILKEELPPEEKDCYILFTVESVYTQRSWVSVFRKLGFDKNIVVRAELSRAIYKDYQKSIWEREGSQFTVVDTENSEENHHVAQRVVNGRAYRFRVCNRMTYAHIRQVKELISADDIIREYEKDYPECDYIPCDKSDLMQVRVPNKRLEVYLTKCHVDKGMEDVLLPDWVKPLQVGKALTEVNIAQLQDNTGEHISGKNRDYSEGTGLYWMWKNTSGQDYIGLFHYRRHMALGEEGLEKLMDYDMTVTIPVYMPVSIKEFFVSSFIPEQDWLLMHQFIRGYNEEYYRTALCYEQGHFYFACNIFIMKRDYFDEMCEFVFAVMEKIDQYYRDRDILREDRYMGFLVENLVSIYIISNRERLKLACTDMKYYTKDK